MMRPAPSQRQTPSQPQGGVRARRLSAYGITPRALLIGTLLIPALCFWNVYSDIVAQSTELAVTALGVGVTFALLVLLAVNAALKRWLPRLALTQAELLFIYILQTVSISISSVGMMQFLIMMQASGLHEATPENQWAEKFHPYLRAWAFPRPDALRGFYHGQSSFFTWAHVSAWLGPILAWSAFIVVMLFTTLCLSAILRRRWVEQERLTFPIVLLPLEMTRDGGNRALFANKFLWAGFLAAFALENLAGIAYLYPSIPFVPLKPSDPRLSLTSLFTTSPWNAVGTLEMSFYPVVIGVVYFLPTDVSFSCWFFFFVRKAEDVITTALGFRDPGARPALARIPYIGEQAFGAFIGLALFSLWNMRGYLREVFRTAFRSDGAAGDDSKEPLPYRWALAGTVLGFVGMTAFAVALGMSAWLAALFFLLYLLVVVTYTRLRAEAGLPWAFGPDMTPHQMLTSAANPQVYGMQNLVGLTQFQWMDLDYRPTLMPYQLEAFKIAGEARMRQRQVFGAILLATVLGTLVAWAAILACYYRYGAGSAHVDSWRTSMGRTPWNILSGWIDTPNRFDVLRLQGMGIGMLVMGLLMAGRARFLWWPFHPVGYALAGTFTMPWLWCATFVGWLIKALILRYGGMKLYRQLLPFFIGLILGDYVSGGLWALFGTLTGVQTYKVIPI